MIDMNIKNLNENKNQEKFAAENFAGLEDIGEELLAAVETMKGLTNKMHTLEKDYASNETEINELYDETWEFTDNLSILWSVLIVKLTTSVNYALNSGTTKTLRKIVTFMDTYGIGDKVLERVLSSVVGSRTSENDFMNLAAIVGAQADDVEFIKQLEVFSDKNKTRENIYNVFNNETQRYGEMRHTHLNAFLPELAFEALIHGSKNVYEYFKKDSFDYVMKYIEPGHFRQRLTEEEVLNILQITPGREIISAIIKHIPSMLPEEIVEVFLF
jgi:hypothetical protein